MKPAFLTFAYGGDEFYKLSSLLLSKIDKDVLDLFVYTDNPDYYKNQSVTTLDYNIHPRSYHHKINAVQEVYNLGYRKILFIDSDILIFDPNFFNDFQKINFKSGFSFTRNGSPENMERFLNQKNYTSYRQDLSKFNFDFNTISSVWEDIFLFNFENVDEDIINSFFIHYDKFAEIKHKSDVDTNNKRFGDQEGYSIIMSCLMSGLNYQIDDDFSNIIKHLRAFNFTYDDRLKSIMSEVEFIFPYRFDSEKRKENLLKVLEFYKSNFKESNFTVSEQGLKQTVEVGDVNYLFVKKDLPHNQSKCINDAVKLSNKKIICVVDADVILLNFYNVYLGVKEIITNELDYFLPYTECFDEPDYRLRTPWGTMCIGGIFMVNREKFIESGMNDERFEGWGREDDERHRRLINKGLRFRRQYGNIIHLWHPEQENKDITGPLNLNLLDGNSNSN